MFDLSVEGSVARLVLSRSEARNAIPVDGWDALASLAEDAVGSGARALILSGQPGDAFCSGADISDFDRFRSDPEARAAFRLAIRDGLDRLRDLRVPTIAVVEGACYGAGVALAMACDIRIAGGRARFAITPAKLGIAYPQEDVHQLVSLVGAGQAARLLLSAASIDGAEAARIGLAELYMESGAAETAAALAEAMVVNDPESLRTLKRAVALAAAGVRQDEEQDRAFDNLLGSDALARGLEAYRGRPR